MWLLGECARSVSQTFNMKKFFSHAPTAEELKKIMYSGMHLH